ncbi:MAG: PEGA domain-containing protein, partial [Myxococcota bacterium]
MKVGGLAISIVILGMCMSCATMWSPRYVDLPVHSEPEGAEVVVDGKVQGVTPIVVHLPPTSDADLVIVRDPALGQQAAPISWSFEQLFWTNVALYVAAPVGWLVDAATGHLTRVDER